MIDIIGEEDCFALLASTTVGRVGLVHDGRVEIIPVNYRMRGRDVIIRTGADGVLAALPGAAGVAFEIDRHDDLSGSGWSVLLGGTFEVLSDAEIDALESAERPLPWAGGERAVWLRLVVGRVSGRRVKRPQLG